MTAEYVTRAIDQRAAPGIMFFYEFDPLLTSGTFDAAFVPAMARHRCARVYNRDVPSMRPDTGPGGALIYGYACAGG